MGKTIDLTGQRFGQLTVVEKVGKNKHRNLIWKCKCDCGNESFIAEGTLKNGSTKSCGCLHKKMSADNAIKNLNSPKAQKKRRKTFIKTQCKDGTVLCNLTQSIHSNNTSGIKGVSWYKLTQKWKVYIKIAGKGIHVGYFDTLEAAAKARAVAEEQYFKPILEKYKEREVNGK